MISSKMLMMAYDAPTLIDEAKAASGRTPNANQAPVAFFTGDAGSSGDRGGLRRLG
jgi:hypothetical protein